MPAGVSLITQPPQVLAVGSLVSADELVAIKTRYPAFAPATGDQLRVAGNPTFVAPFEGEPSVGAGNSAACTRCPSRVKANTAARIDDLL